MPWYSDKQPKALDFSNPIFVKHSDDDVSMLMPVHGKDTYTVIGYDWFNVTKGKWNSCHCWRTPEEAINDPLYFNRCYNGKITITK